MDTIIYTFKEIYEIRIHHLCNMVSSISIYKPDTNTKLPIQDFLASKSYIPVLDKSYVVTSYESYELYDKRDENIVLKLVPKSHHDIVTHLEQRV